MRAWTALIAVFLTPLLHGAEKLTEQDRIELMRGLVAEYATVKRLLPRAKKALPFESTGSIDKQHKHQTYDLTFQAAGRAYTCRTNSDDSMNATDFIVGHEMHYEINGKKVKIKTPENKKVECKVIRVADAITQ